MNQNRSFFLLTSLVLGFAFLYIPILSVIVYSFNESRLVTVWGGFSAKWYGVLFNDRQMLEGIWLSLRIAAVTATGAVIIGTLAGLVLARFGKFFGRTTLAGMVTAPLVMPEVVTGLSLLLLFVTIAPLPFAPDQRGFSTIAIAHITLTMSYVTVVVQSRLSTMDESLEEAAMDLGANEWATFRRVTFPMILPGIMSGALLAFTLSLDDFVITFFTNGPGSTTLPIYVYGLLRRIITPQVNALSTVWILVVFIAVLLLQILQNRDSKQRS